VYGDRNPGSKHAKEFYFSEYNFRVDDESTDYTIHISLIKGAGNLSDHWYDFTYSDGVKFSAIDRINDPIKDCQLKYHLG
jgi:hypothetical protein